MIRLPPRSTQSSSSAASDVYKRQGLGGGSSNAANCILALNEIWQLNLSKPEIHKIASQFGSDINFFLEGGTAKGENRGEVITKLSPIILNNILLVNPGIEISSAEAYQLAVLPKKGEQHKFNPSNLIGSCFNRLESGIRNAYPVIDNIINSKDESILKPEYLRALYGGDGSWISQWKRLYVLLALNFRIARAPILQSLLKKPVNSLTLHQCKPNFWLINLY